MRHQAVLSLVLFSMLAPVVALGFNPLESENSNVTEGNELLANGQFGDALASYDEAARSLPGRSAVHLNRGLALSRMGDEKTEEAMQAFSLALDGGAPRVRARAHSNLGNMFFKKEDFAAAIDHYKKSLMLAPGNRDVAWNLELAAARKKQQDEQQKQQEEQQKDDQQQQQDGEQEQQESSGDDQQQQQDGEQQKKQDESGSEKDQEQEQQQPESEQQKKEPDAGQQEQQPQPQPSPKTRQEMEQILDSLEKGEDNLARQKARQRGALVPRKSQKDW